jgi:DNA-binding NtrC family response regulator
LPHVLVVDDEASVARAMERWLTRLGATVRVLNHPADFEAVLLAEQPAIVISDYLMPVMDGVAVLGIAQRLLPSARRCLLSGSLFLVTPQQRASLEPCLFVEKPWDREVFAAQLGLNESAPS